MQSSEEHVGQAILSLTSDIPNQPLSLGRRTPLGTLVRLLKNVAQAVSAESMRLEHRADFFWREALRQLDAVWHDDAFWSDLRQHPSIEKIANERAMDGQRLRDTIAREVVADSLWTLRTALQPQHDGGGERGAALTDYLRQLSAATGALDAARMDALCSAVRDEVARSVEEKRWERAETLVSWLLDAVGGEEHETLFTTTVAAHAIAELAESQEETAARANAARLAEAIRRIEQLQERARRNAALFDVVAELQVRMAVQLANGGRLSDALVAVQKSATCDPVLQTAHDVRDKLAEMMKQLRQEADALRAKVAATPNAALTGKGHEMLREAERGFGPVNAFVESPAAAQITERLLVAQGAAAWRSIGLAPEHPSDEQLTALYRALNAAFHHAHGDPAQVPAAWRQTIGEVQGAATLDADRIVPWIRNRVAGVATATTPVAPVAWPAGASAVTISRASRFRDHEPFTSWLLSRQAMWAKAACAAALLALCVSIVMFARDAQSRRDREAAFAALRAARAAGEYTRVLDAAETFLSNHISAPDPRDAEVRLAYSEALVRWFTEQAPGPDGDRRAARYRTLMVGGTAGGSRQ